jgi:hypothetical protein
MIKGLGFFFLLIPAIAFTQNLEQKLQGIWLGIGIVDSTGVLASGEIGGPSNYLKFEFEAKKLFIALAPFDKGSNNRVAYREDYFELLNTSFSQKRYKVRQLTAETLVLETVAPNNKVVFYHFVNASKYARDLEQVSNFREYKKLILEITYINGALGYYISSYYLLDNSILNLLPGPVFVDEQSLSFGYYLGANLRLMFADLKELKDKETAMEFDVTGNGIENISITRKLGDEIDFQLFDLVRTTSKKWKPLELGGKIIETRIKINISFSYKEE